jgi:hypothetical protein
MSQTLFPSVDCVVFQRDSNCCLCCADSGPRIILPTQVEFTTREEKATTRLGASKPTKVGEQPKRKLSDFQSQTA